MVAGAMSALVRAQRGDRMVSLQKALEAIARRNGALLQENRTGARTETRWFVTFAGQVSEATAQKIMNRPDVYGAPDAMFPGMHQTWRTVK